MTAAHVSAILVNYNAGAELRDAIQSVASELADRDWEAVVVDNASSDGSVADVEDFDSRVRVLHNRQNVGFGRAVNQGLRATSGAVVLIMNPDCRLAAGAFERLGVELDRWPRCALAAPRILNPDGSPQGSARGDPDMLTGLFGRTAALRRLFPELRVSRRNVVADRGAGLDNGSIGVDWVSGACMLARRPALEQVGGFDERYFLYWEDADLCRRLRACGYQVRYVPAATAVHQVGYSSRSLQPLAIRAFHESAYLYYATHVASHSRSKRLLARALLSARCRLRLLRTSHR